MKVDGRHYRTIWEADGQVRIIDQTVLPHEFRVLTLSTMDDAAHAIRSMQLRGAPLIGAAAAYGMALAMRADPSDDGLRDAADHLMATRPTAVNLRWGLERCTAVLGPVPPAQREAAAFAEAAAICEEDVARNRDLGEVAARILSELARDRDRPVSVESPLNVLTHCNAGWLATVDHGTATAGLYRAHDEGLPLHVWVDETRPRGQGGRLTAWELGRHGVPHTVITDTSSGHLMASGRVDAVFVGTDRTAASGDVANKIGTYNVALAARDNGVPFYVAAPGPSIDFRLVSGEEIPIEERSPDEVRWVTGRTRAGQVVAVEVIPGESAALNYAFDVTPARLVTGIVTERGVADASPRGLAGLYPEEARSARSVEAAG